jgi:hypothetical protein
VVAPPLFAPPLPPPEPVDAADVVVALGPRSDESVPPPHATVNPETATTTASIRTLFFIKCLPGTSGGGCGVPFTR